MPFPGEKDAATKNGNRPVLRPLAGNPASDMGPSHPAMRGLKEEEEKGKQICMDFTVVWKKTPGSCLRQRFSEEEGKCFGEGKPPCLGP